MSLTPEAAREVNRRVWDERAPAHAASADYGVARFVADPDHLSDVVRFDQPRLGDVTGLRGLHLQCHIGTDTVSLSRLGARMTGLDLSGASLEHARRLAAEARADVAFVEADAYDAVATCGADAFDLVYTGIGALCWLPDIARWGRTVGGLLAPGGRLFLREAHPLLWALDERQTDRLVVDHPWFETAQALELDEPGTYVETDVTFEHTTTHTWNHGLGEIVTSLLDAGLVLTGLVEHDSVPYDALPGQMVQGALGEWRLRERPERLAASYTLQAVKPT